MHVIFCCNTTRASAESLNQGGKAPFKLILGFGIGNTRLQTGGLDGRLPGSALQN